MRTSRFAASATALLIGATALGWSAPAGAKTKVIYSLPSQAPGGSEGRDGSSVNATDAAGNIYGVTFNGGLLSKCPFAVGCGTIFELMPPTTTGGPWTEQTLYAFSSGASGSYPTGLTRDSAGNLYGAAQGGEIGGKDGDGLVWELSPPAVSGGPWSFHVLYTFSPPPGGPDGAQPCGALVRDASGTLYGTALSGGAFDGGVVFSLAPPPPGGLGWTETVLHSFPGHAGRTVYPTCPLTLSAGGRVLYGATRLGRDTSAGGTVFRLRRQPGGWVYRQIFSFPVNGSGYPDGESLNGGLVIDKNGNLFGTAEGGGANDAGTVFELSPPAAGQTVWTEQTLHSFAGGDGRSPTGGLTVGRGLTALFGTTDSGGPKSGGVVFRLDAPASGSGPWTYTILNDFGSQVSGTEPRTPLGALIFGHAHKLFGTTLFGGSNRGGTVFSQTPDFPQTPQ